MGTDEQTVLDVCFEGRHEFLSSLANSCGILLLRK